MEIADFTLIRRPEVGMGFYEVHRKDTGLQNPLASISKFDRGFRARFAGERARHETFETKQRAFEFAVNMILQRGE